MGEGLHDSRDYFARARSLGPALAAAADEIERNRELPAPIVSARIDDGLFRLLQPCSLGGVELDPMTCVQVVEQIASHDVSTGGVSNRRTAARWLPPFSTPMSRRKLSDRRTASSPGARSATVPTAGRCAARMAAKTCALCCFQGPTRR